jgi:hypothetical protein
MKDNKKKHLQELFIVASEWWGDVVLNPKQDNGDSMQSAFASGFSKLVPEVTKEQRDKFVNNLLNLMPVYWEQWEFMVDLIISIDYGVGGILKEANENVGINDLKFPMKTDMRITESKVEVSYGYCAEWKTIKEIKS